jgi:hypothetical protein
MSAVGCAACAVSRVRCVSGECEDNVDIKTSFDFGTNLVGWEAAVDQGSNARLEPKPTMNRKQRRARASQQRRELRRAPK